MKRYIDDNFYWDGECVACVFMDEDEDFGIEYRMERTGLYLGAVLLFIEWEKEMVDKYKDSWYTKNVKSINKEE